LDSEQNAVVLEIRILSGFFMPYCFCLILAKKIMKHLFIPVAKLLLTLALFLPFIPLKSQQFQVSSPDNKLGIKVSAGQDISWQLTFDGKVVIEKAIIGINFSDGRVATQSNVIDSFQREENSVILPEVPYKNAEIKDHYNELILKLSNDLILYFRTYNDGAAYRFENLRDNPVNIVDEQLRMNFPKTSRTWFPEEQSMYSHNERSYLQTDVSEIKTGSFCSLPVMFETPSGVKVVFTETDLRHFPNMFLQKQDGDQLVSLFPKFVLEAVPNNERSPDRNELITKEADYIAKTDGSRNFPWRVFIVSDDDGKLIESNLAYQLASPCQLKDTRWIKPGKVAWDWYNANNIYGVNFRAGLNTETYKYYIDFAAANNIEYVIFDEGWTKSTTEILDFNPDINVKELIRYANGKNVGIILWVLWKPLNSNMDEILQTYKSWGAKGIKVDFMQRSDQTMVSSYETIAVKAAELGLLVDFHGAFKPAGLQRMYPNVLNFEGVKGAENNKWCDHITPDHNLTIPFIRMAAGPMDYTPGAMINANKGRFYPNWERPMSQGTRCHQIAMYVVYEAPLQMMCESPSTYLREQECVDFITRIPTSWDETKVLKAKTGDYLVIARRSGKNWFIAAMTDWTARSFDIPLDFITGSYTASIMRDGHNADRFAQDYSFSQKEISANDTLTISMQPGGGYTAILLAK